MTRLGRGACALLPALALLGLAAAAPAEAHARLPRLDAPAASKLSHLSVLAVAYLSLNSSLNLLNKWSLGVFGFRFPLLLTSCHMAFSFVVLAPAALCVPWHAHRAALSRQWRGVAAVGVTSSASVALNLMSLQDISLTLNQVIRSSIPVVTCLLAVVIERKRPSGREAAALATLSAGVMLAVWQGRLEGGGAAIALCAASTLCSGAMMTLSGRLLSERLGVARLAFYTAPVSLACLLPFMLALERRRFLAFWPHHRGGVALVVGLTSVTAVTYNLVHSLMIQRTSAVTTTVLGEVKILGLLVLSAAVLGEARQFAPKFLLGCALAMAGFALYTDAQLRKLRRALQPQVAALLANTRAGGGGAGTRIQKGSGGGKPRQLRVLVEGSGVPAAHSVRACPSLHPYHSLPPAMLPLRVKGRA